MKKCTHCSAVNLEDAICCKVCGEWTFFISRQPGSQMSPNRVMSGIHRAFSTRSTWILSCICFSVLGGEVFWQQFRLNQVTNQLATERKIILADRAIALADQDRVAQARLDKAELEHLALMQNPAWRSGALAHERHDKEWVLRTAHDSRFAKSVLETNLLTMEQLGQDSTLAAKTALGKVAQLASPKDSRVEVDPDGDGFRVRVAFLMSRLTGHEAGAVTKYHTADAMRSEIKELSAHLLMDLYDYCGSRGIKSISVTCNHTLRQRTIPSNATDEERMLLLQQAKAVPAKLYRMSLDQSSARMILDWRRVSISQVTELSTVEYDGLTHLTITQDAVINQDEHDAAGELQF